MSLFLFYILFEGDGTPLLRRTFSKQSFFLWVQFSDILLKGRLSFWSKIISKAILLNKCPFLRCKSIWRWFYSIASVYSLLSIFHSRLFLKGLFCLSEPDQIAKLFLDSLTTRIYIWQGRHDLYLCVWILKYFFADLTMELLIENLTIFVKIITFLTNRYSCNNSLLSYLKWL